MVDFVQVVERSVTCAIFGTEHSFFALNES